MEEMEKRRILVIINPRAAKGRAGGSADDIAEAFTRHGLDADCRLTEHAGHALTLAREASSQGYGTVVAAGGDGCVNEAVSGIMEDGAKVTMGVIPIGRGNDFAWVAGIPRKLDEAVELVAQGQGQPIDVGYIEGGIFPGGRYFLNGAGFGFEPAINFKAASYAHLNGMPSYIVAFFHCLMHIPQPYHLRMTVDGQSFELSSQQVSVANGRRMGSAFLLTPNAILDDGLLDIVYASRPVNRRQVIPMVLSFFRGTQLETCSFMEQKRGREVVIESREGMKVHVDGEFVADDARRCLVRILPGALRLHYSTAGRLR